MFHFFFLPLIPLTVLGACVFDKKAFAYGVPAVLLGLRLVGSPPAPLNAVELLSLALLVWASKKIFRAHGRSLRAFLAAVTLGVFLYEAMTNLAIWILGACLPGEPRLYALSFAGLAACLRASLPFALVHWGKALSVTVGAAAAFALARRIRLIPAEG